MRAPFTPSGEPTPEFVALLAEGRDRGFLAPDDLMAVLEGVELRPELIAAVTGRIAAEGIEWRDQGELLSDEGLDKLAAEVAAERPLGRGRSRPHAESNAGPAAEDEDRGEAARGPLSPRRPRDPYRSATRVTVAGLTLDVGAVGAGSSDSVRAYLKEIGRARLLTGEQEVALARCVERGVAAAARLDATGAGPPARRRASASQPEVGKGSVGPAPAQPPLEGAGKSSASRRRSVEKQREADERARAEGLVARQVLVEANLRLVVSVAKFYRNRGLSFLDLIQEGNIGLMRAVEKFDWERGFKFSTYAMWWIRQAISRAIADQARTIRIPVHVVDGINRVIGAERSLLQETGREPTVEEIAARAEMTPERVREFRRINQDTVSLEQPLGDEDFNLSDTVEDEAVVGPGEAAVRSMLAEAVRNVLAHLTEREQMVVRLRFGLDDGEVRTLEEVAREFGVTRERVRQIESKTLAKLRQPVRSGQLRDYLGA